MKNIISVWRVGKIARQKMLRAGQLTIEMALLLDKTYGRGKMKVVTKGRFSGDRQR